MNRTRLAQLTAVLGAAVLLVLAVAVTRTAPGRDSTVVAGPALDQLATQAPGEESPGGDAQDPGAGGDTPVMGPTATAPADPVAPGADGSSTRTPAPGDTGTASAGDTTEGPLGGSSAEGGPLPRVSQDPFAPGASATPPPAADDPVSGPAPGTSGTAEETTPPPTTGSTTTEPTTPAPAGTTTPDGTTVTPPQAADPAPGSATPTAPVVPTEPSPLPDVQTPQPQVHEVVPGDNLWDIVEAALGARASNAEVAVAVDQLYELNRDVIGDDPDLIFPGQVLELPAW